MAVAGLPGIAKWGRNPTEVLWRLDAALARSAAANAARAAAQENARRRRWATEADAAMLLREQQPRP